jgi:hypothetical protein
MGERQLKRDEAFHTSSRAFGRSRYRPRNGWVSTCLNEPAPEHTSSKDAIASAVSMVCAFDRPSLPVRADPAANRRIIAAVP